MFTILGGDGKEYGPVTAAKIHEWISAGRANLQTKARRDSETEWKALGEFAEFAPAPAPAEGGDQPASAAPAAAPQAAAASAAESVDARASRGGTLDISGCIKRGFATGAANFWPLLGVGLLVGLAAGIAGSIPILGILVSLTMTGVFYGGLYYYVVKKVRGEPTELGDAFSGFSVCFGQLVLATLVCVILTCLGFICLILPGIYLAVCWVFTYLIVRDKGLPFWDAMELGRKVITKQWFPVFGFMLLITLMACVLLAVPMGMVVAAGVAAGNSGGTPNFLLMGLGVLSAIGIGLLMMPFMLAMMMHAYEDLFSQT